MATKRVLCRSWRRREESGRVVRGEGTTLLKLIVLKFGVSFMEIEERVRSAMKVELYIWVGQILSATSLAELIAD